MRNDNSSQAPADSGPVPTGCICDHGNEAHEYDRDRTEGLGVCRVKDCDCMGATIDLVNAARKSAAGSLWGEALLGCDEAMHDIAGLQAELRERDAKP